MATPTLPGMCSTRPDVLEEELSHLAFTRLLEWLDDGVDSHGEQDTEMRRRLVSYFDRRDRRSPDELADETLNRVGRTLEGTGRLRPRHKLDAVMLSARFVMLEDVRKECLSHIQYLDSDTSGVSLDEGRRVSRLPRDYRRSPPTSSSRARSEPRT